MKKKILPLLFVPLFSLICCNQQQIEDIIDAKYVIEFDDDHFVDVKDIVSDIQLIELDTISQSAMLDITSITIIDDTMYCFSSSQGGFINKYTMDGRYLGSIKNIGHSHDEWVVCYNMYINPQDRKVIVADKGSMRTLLYNLDGSFVGDCKMSPYDSEDVFYDKGFFYSQTNLEYTCGDIEKETDHKLNVFDMQGNIIDQAIPTTHIACHLSGDVRGQFSWGSTNLLYTPTLYETIYALDSGKILPYATYKYKGTKEEFYTDEEIQESFNDMYNFLGLKSYYTGSVIDTPEYIIRRVGSISAFNVIYNKKTNQTYTTRFYSHSMGKEHLSDYISYAPPMCYYKGRYYAKFDHELLGLPDEYLGDNVPASLKPYIDKVRRGQVNQILVSYKLNLE